MPAEITMPQLSDTMTEGTLVKWLKKEGDKVKSGDKIAEVETDKAVMEQEAFDSGTMAAILVGEGQKIPIGGVMAVLAIGKENPADIKKQYASGGGAKPASVTVTTNVKDSAKSSSAGFEAASSGEMHEADHIGHGAKRQMASAGGGTAVAPPPQPSRADTKTDNGNQRLRISPLARRIAAEKNIDPRSLTGSGPAGRIVKQDVLAHLTAAPSASPANFSRPGGGEKQTIPLTKMRGAIAKSLQASKQNIPHFYETIEADVEELVATRVRLNEMLEPQKIRLSLGDFITKAVAMALTAHPALNATFNGTEITRYGDVHLGIAVAIPDGLIVPVLKNIHLMGLKEIRQRSVDLVDRARTQKLKQDEMTGATFTISSLGTYGIREFSAIINPPQVGILAVATAEKRPVFRQNQIVARTMLSLTLSADHRVVDGATAAEFLKTLKGLLEEPGMMLVMS